MSPSFDSVSGSAVAPLVPAMSATELAAFDREHIWHPYSSMTHPAPVWQVASAQGVRIRLTDGRELVDGMSSWWCAVHGYNHPVLNAALQRQLQNMAHVMFGGLTHEPAIELGRRLLALVPDGLEKVFYSDSGSVAVEVAIKMAIQYQQARGKAHKSRLLALEFGYHGDTLGAMSLCDPQRGMHHLFASLLPQQFFVAAPRARFDADLQDADTQAVLAQDIAALRAALEQHQHDLAAFIVEPILQGAGGMRCYHPAYLQAARELCDEFDVLLIADEIATGFGRTGELFACNHAGISPDIMCLGKAITGGYLTLAATLTTRHVAETISQGDAGCFMHGPTFMANPLACSVACASIDLLIASDWRSNCERINRGLAAGLVSLAELPGVQDVRTLGAIGVVEMTANVNTRMLQPLCLEQGIWVRPFANLVYLMPPLVATDADIQLLTSGLQTAVRAYLEQATRNNPADFV